MFREVKVRRTRRERISTKRNWDPRLRTELSFVRKKKKKGDLLAFVIGWVGLYGLLIG